MSNDIYYFVYKTTNLINGKIYIGKHQTRDIDDGYLGSGLQLIKAIKKYGQENFVREILRFFDNEHDMNDYEKDIITEEFVKQKTNYNIATGGQGGAGAAKCRSKESALIAGTKAAEKLRGRTKETHEYLQRLSDKKYGRTKENCESVIRAIEKYKIWIKENPEKVKEIYKKSANSRRGKTKETCPGRKSQSEKMSVLMNSGLAEEIASKNRGKTKENCEGKRNQAEKISKLQKGRTKYTCEHLMVVSEKLSGENNPMYGIYGEDAPNSKYSNKQRLLVIDLFEQGLSQKEISKITEVKLPSVGKFIQHREKIKNRLLGDIE